MMIDTLIKMAVMVVPALLCIAAARQGPRAWWWFAGVLVLLAINVGLRLEIPIGRFIIDALASRGLEDPPLPQQARIAVGVVVLVLFLSTFAGFALRRSLNVPLFLALAGLAVILAVMALRGASLHAVDRGLGRAILPMINARQLAEGVALMAIAVGALLQYREALARQPLPGSRDAHDPPDQPAR